MLNTLHPLKPHHQRAVDRLLAVFEPDPNFPALLLAGSIARGWERDDSDVDLVLIATDEEYSRRAVTNSFGYFNPDLTDYPGGYVDGKIVNRAFLEEVADHGSEPARAAFVGARIVYSRIPGLRSLLDAITAYPEAERAGKLLSFYTQVQCLQWYMGETERHPDRYLLAHVAADLALYGGRLILAYNRILYPYHKWLTRALAEAKDKPRSFLERMDDLLARPGKQTADAFCESIYQFRSWDQPPEGWPARFMREVEWAWRSGCAPLEDR